MVMCNRGSGRWKVIEGKGKEKKKGKEGNNMKKGRKI